MMRIVFIWCLLMSALGLQAQKLKVESLQLSEGETIAESERRLDKVQNQCAVLKVKMPDVLMRMEGNVIGEIVRRGNEAWVYITSGSKYFRLFPARHMPMDLAFPDYQVKVKSGCVYRLVLADEEEGAGMGADELFATGMSSYLGEDYAQAVPWFERAMKKGSVNAMMYLGNMYHHGQGVERNDKLFFYYTLMAAQSGQSRAQQEMFYIYRFGHGTQKDSLKAVDWLKKAVEQKNPDAYGKLCWCYMEGWGVEKNMTKAAELARKGAEAGDYEVAMVNLAMMYDAGEGVEKSHEKALEWLQKSAKLGGMKAKKLLDAYAEDEFSNRQPNRSFNDLWPEVIGNDD